MNEDGSQMQKGDAASEYRLDASKRIEAILQIQALKARYFRLIDTRDWAGLKQIFTPDAVLDYPDNKPFYPPGIEQPDVSTVIAFMQKALAGAVTVHHGHMPEIQLLASDRATGIWSFEDRIYWPDERPLGLLEVHGFGHYHENYERTEDRWRISMLRVRRLWVETKPSSS